MALADYYSRGAIAASQVLAGFDEQRFRATLEGVRVGVSFGEDVVGTIEGRALLDLLIRLVSRLYPALTIRVGRGGEALAVDMTGLANRINPNIGLSEAPTIEIAIGALAPRSTSGTPCIFVGSNGWDAFVGTKGVKTIGQSDNPFGAGAAACLAAANLFRAVFHGDNAQLDAEAVFSVLDSQPRPGSTRALTGSLGPVVLVGSGAIGNAAAWALSRTPMQGLVHLVDHEVVDLGNLQRYALAERNDETRAKVTVVGSHFL